MCPVSRWTSFRDPSSKCVPVTDTARIVAALRRIPVPRGERQHDPVTAAALRSEELLPFLKVCTTDELDMLVRFTSKAWNADKLFETSLTKHPLYPEHCEYVEEVDRQFRLLGGHTFANVARGGQGPIYRDILVDLCLKAKLPQS